MKLSKDLKVIYLLSIVCSFLLITCWGVQMTNDGPTYIAAWDNNYSKGSVDAFRTPVYPCFLGLLKIIFGTNLFCFIAICIQHVIYLISIKYFYKLTIEFTKSKRIALCITAFYSFFPFIITWNNYVQTESFAICGMVFLFNILLSLIKEIKIVNVISFAILLLLLVFLRPALIYLIPVLGVSFLLMLVSKKANRILGILGLAILMVISFVQIGYMKLYENKYEIFASSSVGIVNQLRISFQNGLLMPSVIENLDLKSDIEKSYNEKGIGIDDWFIYTKEADYLMKRYDLPTLQNAIINSYKQQPSKVISKSIGRAYRSSTRTLLVTLLPGFNSLFDMVGFDLNSLYFFIIVYSLVLLYYILKSKVIPLLSILMLFLGVCNIIVALIGAEEDWNRLILPSMPLYILMFGQVCSMFKVRSSSNIEFK